MLIVQTHSTHVSTIGAKIHPATCGRCAHKHCVDAAIKPLTIPLLHRVARGQTSDVDRGSGQVGVSDDLRGLVTSDLESDIAPDPRMDPEAEAGWAAVTNPDLALQPLYPRARVERELHYWATIL